LYPINLLEQKIMIAIRTLLTLTLLLGVAYPLAVTGLAQLLFPWQANGSLLTNTKQQVVGSALLAQKFERADYFHSRPSASDFATIGGGGSNLGMSSPLRAEFAAAAARGRWGSRPEAERVSRAGTLASGCALAAAAANSARSGELIPRLLPPPPMVAKSLAEGREWK
jgi:K+-transporting ATPase ATPase C chain